MTTAVIVFCYFIAFLIGAFLLYQIFERIITRRYYLMRSAATKIKAQLYQMKVWYPQSDETRREMAALRSTLQKMTPLLLHERDRLNSKWYIRKIY